MSETALLHPSPASILQQQDWPTLEDHLNHHGYAIIPGLFSHRQCQWMARLYDNTSRFRKRVLMERHGFGQGEYQYFAYPLPTPLQALRETLYTHLASIANRWQQLMKLEARFPPRHADFIAQCHQAGQTLPTPLLLQYIKGDYNCLHQDLYGEHVFPLQMAVLLSAPGKDFTGGEFVMTEQRPRMQSRVEVVPLQQGDAVIFAVHHKPATGTRGIYRTHLRHGVSRILSGHRHTLGVMLHDAEK